VHNWSHGVALRQALICLADGASILKNLSAFNGVILGDAFRIRLQEAVISHK
jgi:hypothetical protein